MPISNAKRWDELCELQITVMGNLANRFPERRENLASVASGWKNIQQQLQQNKTPVL